MSLKVNTTRFGMLEVCEEKIISFPYGIPGFPQLTRFIYIDRGEQDGPFAWLQAVDDPDVAFIIVNPTIVKPDYQITIAEQDIADIDLADASEAEVFVIVSIRSELKDATANLCAPVIINVPKRKGKQIVLDNPDYPIRYPVFGSAPTRTEEVG